VNALANEPGRTPCDHGRPRQGGGAPLAGADGASKCPEDAASKRGHSGQSSAVAAESTGGARDKAPA